MEKSQEKLKGLQYRLLGENAEDVLNKFGKYMTTILNDGGGGVIILKIWANIDVLVDQIEQEIGKITPRVQDSEYKITSKRRNGDIGEIEIDVEPVPWGFEAYAAADGNIYTPETGDHATDENQMDFQFEYTEPKMNTKMKPTVEIGEMETHSDCELGDIRQEKTDKNTGAPPSDIKEIIDDCVNDLRDIKAKLGISNRCDQAEKMDTKKITSDVEKCIISVSEEEKTDVLLHHCKSLSDCVPDEENRRPVLQRKSMSLKDTSEFKTVCEDFEFNQCKDFNSFPTTTENWIQVDGEGYMGDVDHRESDSEYFLPQLDGMYTSEFKTVCEDFEFNQCKDFNSFPATTENWIQVDGEGYMGDVDHRESDSEYFLPQLDGMYDEENIQAKKSDPDYANNDVEILILAENIRREQIIYYDEEWLLAEMIKQDYSNDRRATICDFIQTRASVFKKIVLEDQIHFPMPKPIDVRLQQFDQWIQVKREIQRIQNRGRNFKDRIGCICSDYCDRYQQRGVRYTPFSLIGSKTRELDDMHTARRRKKEFLSSSVAFVVSCNINEGYPERKVQVPNIEFTKEFPYGRIQITKTNQWEWIMTNELASVAFVGSCNNNEGYPERKVQVPHIEFTKEFPYVRIQITKTNQWERIMTNELASVAFVGSCNSNEGYPERKVQVPNIKFTKEFPYVRIQITETNQWERIMTNELAGKEDRDLYNTEECISMVPDTHFKTTQVVSKVRTLIPIAFPVTYQFGFTVTTEPGCLVIV